MSRTNNPNDVTALGWRVALPTTTTNKSAPSRRQKSLGFDEDQEGERDSDDDVWNPAKRKKIEEGKRAEKERVRKAEEEQYLKDKAAGVVYSTRPGPLKWRQALTHYVILEPPRSDDDDDEDDDEDYMKMKIPSAPKTQETSAERVRRVRSERRRRAHPPPRAIAEAEAAAKRERAMATALDSSNKGFRMLSAMGYKGGALGPEPSYDSLASIRKHLLSSERTHDEPSTSTYANATAGIGAAPDDEADCEEYSPNVDSDTDRQTHMTVDGDANANYAKDPRPPGLTEPISVEFRKGRSGIGHSYGGFREPSAYEIEREKEKKDHAAQDTYKSRLALEAETARLERLFHAAMKTAEGLDLALEEAGEQAEEYEEEKAYFVRAEAQANQSGNTPSARDRGAGTDADTQTGTPTNLRQPKRHKKLKQHDKPLNQINLLYRQLVHERRARETEKKERQLQPLRGLDTLHSHAESDDDDDTGHAEHEHQHAHEPYGRGIGMYNQVIDEHDYIEIDDETGNDSELDQFLRLDVQERLSAILNWMRKERTYCFWCKARYDNPQDLAENCPGVTEADHE